MMIAAYGLSKFFPVRGALRARTSVKAVDDVTIRIDDRQIVGLVGESGSGKSTLGRTLISLIEPTAGDVLFDLPSNLHAEYEQARADDDEETQARIRAAHSVTHETRFPPGGMAYAYRLLGLGVGAALGAIVPAFLVAFSRAPFTDPVMGFLWATFAGMLVGSFGVVFVPQGPRWWGNLIAGVGLLSLNVGIGLAVALSGIFVGSKSYSALGALGTGYAFGGIALFVAVLVGAGVAKETAEILPEYLLKLRGEESRASRERRLRRQMNIVLQDPYSSLNPRMKLVDIISEPMLSTGYATKKEAEERAVELLREVGLPEFFSDRYPHELSGGQRQRVAIARAISTIPKLLVLDEPTSALDVSVQAQILNLLRELRDKYGISMLLITHNIAVVAYLADVVYVMYAGQIVERGPKSNVLRDPQHPYTKALMSAVPFAGQTRVRTILHGDPPNLISPPLACRFHPRCPVAFDICGWSAEEVAEDLLFLLRGKYFATFEESVETNVVSDLRFEILGESDPERVREVVEEEKDDLKSLTGIRSITAGEGKLVVDLEDPVDPQLYRLADGREAKCLLYRTSGSASGEQGGSVPAPASDRSMREATAGSKLATIWRQLRKMVRH